MDLIVIFKQLVFKLFSMLFIKRKNGKSKFRQVISKVKINRKIDIKTIATTSGK